MRRGWRLWSALWCPRGGDSFSAGWAGWGEGAGGNGTLSPNGHGPVYLPGTLFPGPARAPYQAHLNITLTCYAIHDILYVPVLTRPPSFVLFLKRLEGPVCPGARGARPRGGRDTGVLAVPAQARIAHMGAASCKLTRLALAAGEQVLAHVVHCLAGGGRGPAQPDRGCGRRLGRGCGFRSGA